MFITKILSWILLFTSLSAEASIGDDFASPVTTPALPVFLTGTILTLGFLATEDQTVDPAQQETVEHKPLGRYSKIGDYGGRVIPNAAYVLSMSVAGLLGTNGAWKHAEVMTLATLYAASVSSVLKVTVREPRPNDGNDRRSFPSGHATTAFAFASVVGAEHGWGYGILAYSLAGLVAYSRMNDNKHRLHDVLAGATIGTSYGLGIHYRHHRTRRSVSLTPLLDRGAYGLSAALSF